MNPLQFLSSPLFQYISSHNVRKHTFWHVEPPRHKNVPSNMCAQQRLKKKGLLIRVFVVRLNKFCFLRAIRKAPSEDSDQTARMRRLIWIFAWCTCPKVRFLTRLNCVTEQLKLNRLSIIIISSKYKSLMLYHYNKLLGSFRSFVVIFHYLDATLDYLMGWVGGQTFS